MAADLYLVQDKEDLQRVLAEAGDKLVVLDCFANWCGNCKMLLPKLVRMSQEDSFKDSCVFVKVNVDDNEDIGEEVGVQGLPFFAFFKGGQMVENYFGSVESQISAKINQLL
eukprot:GILI01005841.1.p1 GENE.GILI01005841.1~~GILI01005841.1.p1  ORF type:complete len:129 (-),score=44.35 GILI01005841.1:162-497(-)